MDGNKFNTRCREAGEQRLEILDECEVRMFFCLTLHAVFQLSSSADLYGPASSTSPRTFLARVESSLERTGSVSRCMSLGPEAALDLPADVCS